jgi:hypothetical protein
MSKDSSVALRYVMKTTFLAPREGDGQWHPAYARFSGNVGNNFLSNTWRADSEANASAAVVRSVWGVLGHMTSDGFEEFWPDVRRKVFKKWARVFRRKSKAVLAKGTADSSLLRCARVWE